LPNLIKRLDSSLFWIDLRASSNYVDESVRNKDMNCLVSSILGLDDINENIKGCIQNYSETFDIDTLASAIFDFRRSKRKLSS
jgi:hypothetical protein